MSEVDVLIMTALPEEYSAARSTAMAGFDRHPGVKAWDKRLTPAPTLVPYEIGEYELKDGRKMSVALARPTRQGPRLLSQVVATLCADLRPGCLAMTGVCAGNPKVVTLGDVVVAEIAYDYDEGRRTEKAFEPDHRQYPIDDVWLRIAQDLSTQDLPSYGPLTDREAGLWLLERLLEGVDPKKHPARKRHFHTTAKWQSTLEDLTERDLIIPRAAQPELTDEGREYIAGVLYHQMETPARLPFRAVVGPMASGASVDKTGLAWDRLTQQGVRTIAALEMEAATIATAAHIQRLSHWLVVKGVMDYADPNKDDRYKEFAARSSSEVFFKLMISTLDQQAAAPPAKAPYPDQAKTGVPAQPQPAVEAKDESQREAKRLSGYLHLWCAGRELVPRVFRGKLLLQQSESGDPKVLIAADGALLAHRSGDDLRVARVRRTNGDLSPWRSPVDLGGLGAGEVLAIGRAGQDDLLFVWVDASRHETDLYLARRHEGLPTRLGRLADVSATHGALVGNRALIACPTERLAAECSAFPDVESTSLVSASAGGRTVALIHGKGNDDGAVAWVELDGRRQVRLSDPEASLVLRLGSRLPPAIVGADGIPLQDALALDTVTAQPWSHWSNL